MSSTLKINVIDDDDDDTSGMRTLRPLLTNQNAQFSHQPIRTQIQKWSQGAHTTTDDVDDNNNDDDSDS